MLEILSNRLFWQWSLVILGLGLLTYSMIVIGREKKSYIEDSQEFDLYNLSLPFPKWWSLIENSEFFYKFARTDTRYDWFATIQYQPLESRGAELTQVLEDFLNQKGIEFDQDVEITTDPRYFFKDKIFAENFPEFIRAEGTGTEGVGTDEVPERVYLDIIFFRQKVEEGHFFCLSHSSVLNGCVEGPYFEEAISRASFKQSE